MKNMLRELQNPWLALAVASMLAIIILFFLMPIGSLRAHDHNHPEMEGWFRSLHSKGGAWCCNGDDAEEAEWDTSGGKYRVRIEGQWLDVPDDAVVEGPNRAGVAKVWAWHMMGQPAVRCFLPGSLT